MEEVTGRQGRRGKQLPNDFKFKRQYWRLKEGALYLSLRRTRIGRSCGCVVRQTAEQTNKIDGAKLMKTMKLQYGRTDSSKR